MYLFSVGRKMTPFPETVSDPQNYQYEGRRRQFGIASAKGRVFLS